MLRTCWIGGNIAMMIVILSMLMIVMMMMMMMVIPLLITGLLPVRMSMSSIASIDAIGARPLRILRIIFRTVASLCPRFLVPTMTITAATGRAQNPCCAQSPLPSRTRWQITYYKLCNCIICGSENGIKEGVLCTVEAATAAEVKATRNSWLLSADNWKLGKIKWNTLYSVQIPNTLTQVWNTLDQQQGQLYCKEASQDTWPLSPDCSVPPEPEARGPEEEVGGKEENTMQEGVGGRKVTLILFCKHSQTYIPKFSLKASYINKCQQTKNISLCLWEA